jgi:uncharacterized membrane protein YoaT (DUF817 family)
MERRKLPLEIWGRLWLSRLQTIADRSKAGRAFFEFLMFGIKQGWACLFGGTMLGLLLVTGFWYPQHAPLARYDFLVLAALAVQSGMLYWRLEDLEEAKVIFAFHIVGTIMEVFKISVGSWIYPEPSLLRIAGVPLFSGFMYASVGSYLARVWRIFDFHFTHYPPRWATIVLASLIYVNFFAHHWLPDIRLFLFAAVAILYWRCTVWFKSDRKVRGLPMLAGFVLVALFIWFAENIGTYSHAWIYPAQHAGWKPVSVAKMGSWFLLMIISFVLVSVVRAPREPEPAIRAVAERRWPILHMRRVLGRTAYGR